MSKHTQGKWKVNPSWQFGPITVIREEPLNATYEFLICSLGDTMAKGDERVANAHLIAAAPEMYDALHIAAGFIAGSQGTESQAFKIISAAIQKAESTK